jgi:2-dehydro-3-deoxyphosphogluconate aldolase/(4S)-4-hydroxy-2-oxoglutarate aldolase
VTRLASARFLPIAVPKPDEAQHLGNVLVQAGLGCLEVALRRADSLEALERACAVEDLLVGAGTVITRGQAVAAAEAGASFALAPGLNEEVVHQCRELGLPFFPGVATPSEIDKAQRMGLSTVKVFPIGALGGVPFLRAVSAAFPGMRFIPTGGINLADVESFLSLSSVVACGGSSIISDDLLSKHAFAALNRRARDLVDTLRISTPVEEA